ncbi:hypothetical protein CCACVL1_14102 [Corchorus capsularis]|uniref:Protein DETOXIFICATION n=1 Tax=Corchorus capsularis TaxID=210143 RepID=A0A1R3I872_COCAP|nr:hypothetical protein CCACVL1_14102 [Corchorus capsularis]
MSLLLTSSSSPSFMSSLSFLVFLLLLSFHPQHAIFVANSPLNQPFFKSRIDKSSKFPVSHKEAFQIRSKDRKLESTNVIIRGKETIQSVNRTFELGFFSTNGESNWYLGIWYASIPTQTRVWVANRENPIKDIAQSSLEITETGQLAVKELPDSIVWQSTNKEEAKSIDLLESGNLVLYSSEGSKIWQSFDFPTDTWLPEMNISIQRSLTSWKSLFDPSPGLFSLRLKPQQFNEFQLVYNSSNVYWSTGNWTGAAFSNVPQMTIRYIYKFHFVDPYLPTASFWYSVRALENGAEPPLTRFQVDVSGQLKQFTWSPQIESWNMFWSEPEDKCRVHGLCGSFGSCVSTSLKPCVCLNGFKPVDDEGWNSGDYTSGCKRESDDFCEEKDGFEDVGDVEYDGGTTVSFQGSRSSCEKSCLSNCSCIGLYHNGRTNLCKNVYGSLLNLRNLSSDGIDEEDVFYIREPREGIVKKNVSKAMILTASIVGSIAVLGFMGLILLVLKKRRENMNGTDEGGSFPGLNLKVFTYKELNSVTRGFSEKLGHGGFGAVFRGELSDSSPVAVKRLERPGSGEKEFRAEVCTIGNIQHVNLVRLRGFCSENSHRLLVYDYMPNGPLSAYLRRDSPNLCWDVRFRVAVGTARGIAYLHEECRDCIIHCDIKPENILLDSDYMAKVSDFGLAKLVGRDFSRVLATMRGTWGYVAPEWISGLAITPKADVYSYGMTLLELIGGRRNVEAPQSAGNDNVCGEGGYEEKWFFPPWAARQIIEGNVAAIVDSRLGVAFNIEEAERLALVAIWCIQDEEQMRPSMGMVVKMLEGVVEVTIPRPPKLIQALVAGESYRGVRMDSGVSAAGGCSDYNVGFSSAGSRSSLGGECDLSSAESTPTMNLMENQLHSKSSPLISNLESAELHPAPSGLISEGGDYPPIQCFADAKNICFIESSKLWAIATPIAFNIWCNYGINSFTNIFVGHIGDIELSAVAIALSVVANFSFGFLILSLQLALFLYGKSKTTGINAAISVRVSNELGSGHPRAAKYSVFVIVAQSLLIGILSAVVILITRNKFAIIFTDSKEMQKAVAHLAHFLGMTMILNSVQPVISGVAVGGGWQALVAYINLFCYYVIGLPLGFLLGYQFKFGVEGIWVGMIVGTFLQTLILMFIIYKTNWNTEVEQASERMRQWGAELSDTNNRESNNITM